MKVLLYKDLSDSYKEIEICANKKLSDSIKIDWSKVAVIVNGKVESSEYIPDSSELIVIRYLPFSKAVETVMDYGEKVIKNTVNFGKAVFNNDIFRTIVTGGFYLGYIAYREIKEMRDAIEDANRAAKSYNKLKNSLNDDVTALPYIKGAVNTLATGKTQPYIIGEHLFSPYVLNAGGKSSNSKGYSTISGTDGENQFYNLVLEGGFNYQVLRKISADDVVLKDWGTSGTVAQEGIQTLDSSIFSDSGNILEIAQDGADFATSAFNTKIVEETSGAELKKADEDDYAPLTYTLQQYSMGADVCIMFNGLISYNKDNGNKQNRTVTVIPQYSLDNGATWTNFTFNQNGTASNSFTRQALKQMRFNAHIDFNYADVKDLTSPVLVRCICNTNKYDGSVYDQCYILWVHSYIYDPNASKTANAFVAEKVIESKEAALSTLIGLHIKSTVNNQDKFNKINIVTSGTARIWDSVNEEWTDTKVPTSNPAAWLIEVLTSHTHAPSKVEDSEIDLDSFGELYEYCETEGLKIDRVITDGDTKENLLKEILLTCNSVMYQNIYGKIAVATDKPKENAVALLNTQNLITFNYKKSLTRLSDGIKLTYIDKDADYMTNTYAVMRNGETQQNDSIFSSISVNGVVNHSQIVKYARRLLATEKLRPKNIAAVCGMEGMFYTPFSKILVQHPSLKIGLGSAEIKSVLYNSDETQIIGLELYEAIEYNSNNENGYGMIIECVNDNYCVTVPKAYTATENGRVTEVLFTTPIAADASYIPHANDILSYGYLNDGDFDTITSPFLISAISPNGLTGYALNLVEYNEAIYDYGDIPDYVPNLTQPSKTENEIPGIDVSTDKTESLKNEIIEGGASVGNPDDVTGLTAKAERDGLQIDWTANSIGLKNVIDHYIIEISTDNGTSYLITEASKTNSLFYTFPSGSYYESSDFATWKVRVKAVNAYEGTSENWTESNVSTTGYGTWEVQAPNVYTRISDRTITLVMSQPARADNKTVYGTIRYRVQVKRLTTPADSQYYKPATNLNPYPDYENGVMTAGNEDNYKDGEGYVLSDGVYVQTMALYGQATDNIIDTLYSFSLVAQNEAGISEDATIVNATAVCTSIRDIVKANETAKAAYISELSAISANLGVIKQGGLSGNDNNYWALSTIIDELGIQHHEGEFRVGNAEKFLKVEATEFDESGNPTNYTLTLATDNFEVLTESTNFNKEIIVYSAETKLDRIRITPDTISVQHRDSINGTWETYGNFDPSGLITPSYKANSQIQIGNFTQIAQRYTGHDIGRAYLSSNGHVWHFDDNEYCQNGTMCGLTLTTATGGSRDLVSGIVNGVDLTPAISAKAPFCTVARSLYGKFKGECTAENTQLLTVDFWMQYRFAEAQTLFNIGTGDDSVTLQVLPQEPVFAVSGSVSWRNGTQGLIYTANRNPKVNDYAYATEIEADAGGESDLTISAVSLNEDYTIATITINGYEYGFESGSADFNYETFAPETEWGGTSAIYNRANSKKTIVSHIGQSETESFDLLEEMGKEFNENEWIHIGIIFTENRIKFLFDDTSYHTDGDTTNPSSEGFVRNSTSAADIDISFNPTMTTIILDELYIDTVVELTDDFINATENRIPWAALSYTEDWFIFDAKDPSKVKSNILDYFKTQLLQSTEFRQAVQEIIGE